MALWIVLGAAGAVLLLLLGASLYFYNFAFLRRGSERGGQGV